MNVHDQITLPERLDELLRQDRSLHAGVTLTINDFEAWFQDNKLPFFPEYTDHGPTHVREVIDSSASLVRDAGWSALSSADAAAIVLAALLHDCAMHLSEDGFTTLVAGEYSSSATLPNELPWPELWKDYLAEASRFDGRTLVRLFGDSKRTRRPPADWTDWTRRDRLLIGDFLRRQHPRLAHEIALWGVPGPGANRLRLKDIPDRIAYVAGLIARSHGIDMRAAAELLPKDERREYAHVHAPYVMGLLRVADYIQIHSARAPGQVLMVRSLRSPISRGEWETHRSVEAITATHEDPEALFVKAAPQTAKQFVKLRRLLDSLQSELDATWAVIGEVYGRFDGLNSLGLTIRRVRSNLDDASGFAQTVSYLPRLLRFDTAGADLLKLLVVPLYGANRAIGIRELLQNAVDSLRERRDFAPAARSPLASASVRVDLDLQSEPATITVSDNGVGMDADVIANYFLRAGASFRHSDTWRLQHVDESGHSRVLRSGRFGVGALAAFLLGDEVHVTTRSLRDTDALTFSATINDDVVEVRRTSAPVGTRIVVPLSPSASEELRHGDNGNIWDWYCLADPPVIRTKSGKTLKQRIEWPSENAVLPCEWRRIHHPDYSDIQWSCWLRSDTPELVVNGLVVISWLRPYAERHGSSPGHPEYLVGKEEYDPRTLMVTVPHLSVFDPDGNLPLTLQRDALSVEQYPFADELLDSVIQDFVAHAALTAPDDPRAFGAWVDSETIRHPLVSPPRIQSRGSMLLPFWVAPTGWALLDEASFEALSVKRLLVAMRPHSTAIGMPIVDFGTDHLVAMNVDHHGVQAANAWLRLCLGGMSSGMGPLNFIRSRGATGIVSRPWYERITTVTSKEIAKDLLDRIAQVQHYGDWTLLRVGEAVSDPSAKDFESLVERKATDEYEGFAEILVAPTQPKQMSRIMSRWLAAVGSHVLPFSRAGRDYLESHAGVAQCLSAYREQLHKGPLRRGKDYQEYDDEATNQRT